MTLNYIPFYVLIIIKCDINYDEVYSTRGSLESFVY